MNLTSLSQSVAPGLLVAMPQLADSRTTVHISHHYAASPARVFDAWLTPQQAGLWLFATAARLALLPFGWACAAQSGAHGCGRVTREVELRSSTVIAGGYPGYFRK